MKKQIFFATVLAFGAFTTKAQEYLSIEMNDNTVHEFRVADIKEVKIRVPEENPSDPVSDAIDLGLPSGTLWASWNIGASKPEEYGGYYAWGDIEEKDNYNWDTYKFGRAWDDGDYIGDDISGTPYDVAHVKWGGKWTMPTLDQIKELKNNCTSIWTSRNGVKGRLVTGPNGASIFLPAAGCRRNNNLSSEGEDGYYWSSSFDPYSSGRARYLGAGLYTFDWSDGDRCYGYTVRAVKSPVSAEAIDLGLPSGTKWANCNVGANSPEEYGGYYAWGETEEKDVYSKDTYKYLDYNNNYIYIGDDIAGTEYDVAHVKWKGEWRMPTKEQIDELIDNCTTKVSLMNNVKGMLVTGPNGNTIFLPFSGCRIDDYLSQEGRWGNCWSSSLDSSSSAYILNSYYYGFMDNDSRYRDQGRSVRPVCK